MTVARILRWLDGHGDPRRVAAWRRLGLDAGHYRGVPLARIRALAREIGRRNHGLAVALWNTGIHDARLLATWVEDPLRADDAQLDRWVETAEHRDLSDRVCWNVVILTPLARAKVADWRDHPRELVRRSAYVLLGELARRDRLMTDADFVPHVDAVQSLIRQETYWVREAMYRALLRIGMRNRALNTRVLAGVARIGPLPRESGPGRRPWPDVKGRLEAVRATGRFVLR